MSPDRIAPIGTASRADRGPQVRGVPQAARTQLQPHQARQRVLRRATRGAVVRAALRYPFMPLLVSALIRYQGIKLWARRLPVVSRPEHKPQKGVQ